MLLDRLEERVRLIEAASNVAASSAAADDEPVDIGPAPTPADAPEVAPTEDERLRLLALVATHDHLAQRLELRRRSLRQAQQYRLGAA